MNEHRWKKGESGNPDGRLPASREKFKWEFLDVTAIPRALEYLYEVVNGTDETWKAIKDEEKRTKHRIDAAKALLAKAPQRMTGEDGGAIQVAWMSQ